MARIATRKVKGRTYYYLEESVKRGTKWVKESVYLGSSIPQETALIDTYNKFSARLAKLGIKGVTPPHTEFITRNIAERLERAAAEKAHFVASLSPKQRADFTRRERITFITDSNAIEGSTLDYTLTDRVVSDRRRVERLLKQGFIVTNIGREEQEALNLDKCLDIYETLLSKRAEVSEAMILGLHSALLAKIDGYEQYRGVWRPVNVMVRGSSHVFPHHGAVPGLMADLIRWHNRNRLLMHPVELAAKFHTKFTSIHPFADGNGRMARLLMNYILQLNGFPFTNIPLRRRSTYMRTQAAGNKEDYKPFTLFLAEEAIKQCRRLGGQQAQPQR